MNSKQKLPISILMMTIGIVVFLWILIRFFNQGYFGGDPRVLYNFPFEMKDWFGSAVYSFLFFLSGYFLLKKETKTLFLSQLIAIGIIVDRIWYVIERLSSGDVLLILVAMLLLFFSVLYLMSKENNLSVFLKKVGLLILLNLIMLSIGKFILPNM